MPTEYFPLTVGNFNCLLLQDRLDLVSLEMAFPNAKKSDLEEQGLAGQQVPLSYTCLYVDTDSHKVLVDTGSGPAGGGRLVANLEAAGIEPNQIDTIVLTHAHSDHYGGLLDVDGQRLFPNAEIAMSRAEWEYHSGAEYLESLRSENIVLYASFERNFLALEPYIRLIDDGEAIVAGVQVVAAPGHTAHHIALEIQSNGETLLNAGDVWIHPISVEHPKWRFFRDADAQAAIRTRHLLAQRATKDDIQVLGYHFPFPGLVQIRAENGDYRCEPAHHRG